MRIFPAVGPQFKVGFPAPMERVRKSRRDNPDAGVRLGKRRAKVASYTDNIARQWKGFEAHLATRDKGEGE